MSQPDFAPLGRWASTCALIAAFATGCASTHSEPEPVASPVATAVVAPCEIAAARPWIERWFAAWELTSRDILRLPAAPPPQIVFYDGACVYTTSEVAAGGEAAVAGPRLGGVELSWRALAHTGSLTLPDASQVPVQLMSFTSSTPDGGPFFVMAAPPYWVENGHGQEPGLTAVFLHEFAHTRQIPGMKGTLGPLDAGWSRPEELNDDAVQKQFQGDPDYVAAYLAERDRLYAAAAAPSVEEARSLAASALAMMRSRHARWFVGDRAVFAQVDDIFLSLEGVGQWAGVAWLAHPEGGGLDREAAIAKMLGSRKWWVQDEGLALLLAVDRLLPQWPQFAFGDPAMGASELLAHAVEGSAVPAATSSE